MAKEKGPAETPPTHPLLDNPDLTGLRAAAEKYMAYLRDPTGYGHQLEHYERDVLEKAFLALYGPTIHDEINALIAAGEERYQNAK